ncbi:MAG: SAM-dependent DNA methyltransferase [Pyrinomonadaceae bacterium]
MAKTKEKAEFGDFQTPEALAAQVCALLARLDCKPASLIEPTCGEGNLLFAALNHLKTVRRAVGLDVSPDYVAAARRRPAQEAHAAAEVRIEQGNFFDTDWGSLIASLPNPLLVIGNPPWITNAALSTLGSSNVPTKTNFQKHVGLDAVTGKSNFDISEWMLIRILHWLDGKDATLAMLCKTSVARKVLAYAWKHGVTVSHSAIYRINAAMHFGASVDACLLVCDFAPLTSNFDTPTFSSLTATEPEQIIGYRDGEVIASVEGYGLSKHLRGYENNKWRSGIKHDCSKVMELTREGDRYRNGLGVLVELEPDYLFPMMKSSEVAGDGTPTPKRWMLVPQRSVREDTAPIRDVAPKTWEYLEAHGHLLDKRGSSIYKNRARFSVFGIGEYSFAEWKVAISGFYKKFSFKVIGSYEGKPIVLDDTSYFIPCETRQEAEHIASMLNTPEAKAFFESFVFWDTKRPITVDLLRRLDLDALEREVGLASSL